MVWAEENTRDSIFTALKNRETYGTSGTRIVTRFFGGWNFDDDACGGDFVTMGYAEGVPMGGDLPPRMGGGNPRFVAAAWMDESIGTPLDQIQIIKGWVDAEGETHEEVYNVAGGDLEGGVDADCNLTGTGHPSLCGVWEDLEFDPTQPAFYYVRVLENPVCRYSTHLCREEYGLDPREPRLCNELLARLKRKDPLRGQDAQFCCSNETTLPIVQPVIQERAWTSPIWYTPEGE